jgi:hypothetical protein
VKTGSVAPLYEKYVLSTVGIESLKAKEGWANEGRLRA